MKTYPLTQSQLGMFLEWNANRASTQYSICYHHILPKSIDIERLQKAIEEFVQAHDAFRIRFVETDGEIRQYADSSLKFEVVRREMSDEQEKSYRRTFPRPFDPFSASPIRLEIVETDSGYALYVEAFHPITDGTSMREIHAAISALYNGGEAEKEETSFLDYAEREAEAFETDDYRAAKEAAKTKFEGKSATTAPAFGAAREEDAEYSYLSGTEFVDAERVREYCRENELNANLFFLGAFARVLSAFANEREVVFYTVNHGRGKDPTLRFTQGFFVKTLPVLGVMDKALSAVQYFNTFRIHRAGAYPFTHFCRDLGIVPSWGCIFQDGTLDNTLKLGGVVSVARDLMCGGAGTSPALQVIFRKSVYELRLTASKGRYTTDFMRCFVASLKSFIENVVERQGTAKLGEIPLLSREECEKAIRLAKGETLDYDREKTFVDLLLNQVESHPDAVAVVDSEKSITYGELDAASNALAAKLIKAGVKAGEFVGVMLPRTVAFPVAAIAAQKCGAGYVPMDSDYPTDRLAYMLENSEAKVLVTTRKLFGDKGIEFKGEVVFFEVGDEVGVGQRNVNFSTPDTPAYMIYTSGSTGKPKGVVVPNRALSAMIAWFVRDTALGVGKRNLSITSFSFDASVPDLFPPLAAGGELHILSEETRKDLEGVRNYAVKIGATGLTTSTQLGLALVNTYPELPLEYMMLGGEKMVPFAKTPVRILNGYGPTEFAVCSSYHEVDQSREYDIPIGRAVPNTYSLIVDKLGQLLPRGMIGELALAGGQIADGYWKLPEKTAQTFVEGPVGRMYLTGDLARYDDAGELEFLGRIDFQVKLRGFRIEIGEIEHAAASFPGVGAVAAEVREVAGAKHLVLYYEGEVDVAALKSKMAETLTGYMVPDFFARVHPMPLTPNGKIDRKKLPAPEANDEPIVAPEGEVERKIFETVAAVLKTDRFGVTHDFNRLGLTSLGAMSLLAKLKKECGFAFTMKTLVENPTVRALARIATVDAPKSASRKRPRRATYPMTENQRGIYSDWLRNPGAVQYNIPAVFKFASLKPETLAEAAKKTIAAHPAFGAHFVEKDGEVVEERQDDFEVEIPIERLAEEPTTEFFTARLQPFKPTETRLFRAVVFAAPKAAYLFLDVHHTIFDGFSVGILLGELKRVLGGAEAQGESYTAFDAALDERDYLESETVEEDDKWFARYLDDVESTALETSSGANGKAGEAGRIKTNIPSAAIAEKARASGVTASDWFLTAFTELLRRIGREEAVNINFVTSGRGEAESQEAVGMFVKTLPIRGIKDATSFVEAARAMHRSVSELISRERYSYVRLSEKLGVRPEILFAFEGGIFDLPDGVELLNVEPMAAKVPLAVVVTPGKDDFELKLEYDRAKYSERDMTALLGMFSELSTNAAKIDELKEIPLTNEAERARVMELSTGEAIEYDETKTVVNLVKANAIANPLGIAVVDAEKSITYGELDAKSDALAARLIEAGAQLGGFVGVMLPRTVAFPVAAIAVQKCGAGYVPMDSDYPADRLAYMLENSEAKVLVTTRELFAGKDVDFKGEVVFFEVGDEVGVGQRNVNLSTPDTPAYMIYTSGSTGKPKGVVVQHRALRHLVAWTIERLKLSPGRKIATHPSFSFDASVIDIFPALSAGCELHIYSEAIRKDLAGMRDYIVKNGIYGGTMSTQIGMTLLDTYPDLPLNYLIVGGEKLMPISRTKVKIFNGYGPTEFAVCSSMQLVDQSREGDIPIGRAAPGTSSLIVDRYGQLLPLGYAGELALSGPQIADGYWKLPEKTAKTFIVTSAGRMYKTGDLARYNDEGTLDYLGRLDFQIKLRGFRIEIGEIEHCASTYSGVKGVAAEGRDVAGAKHLVLYYGSETPIDETALKAHLASSLTEYMVPDYYVRMEVMPLTPNGKINRKKLPAPEGVASVQTEYVEPANETERKIAECYGKILKVEKFGALDDFFVSGGTSLVGIKAVVALQKAGLDVQYGDIFKYKTPRALAAFLDPALAKPEESASADVFADYDYTEIDRLLMATPTELFKGFRRHSLGDVLLTGATGYLGVHVLKYLLESTDSTVYALVRPKRGVGAEKRLGSQYVYYFGERIPARYRDRLVCVEGELSDFALEGEKIDTVINCAALVKHYVADDLMRKINVEGVKSLIAWCEKHNARLVHTSTYSVGGFVRADSSAVLDERHLYIGQESDNEYVRTKFLAEREVLAAVASGKLRGKVMRLGNLMGREVDGEFQMNVGANAFVNSLKSYRAIGAYPLEDLVHKIEMSPIDRVAEAVCLLSTLPDGMCVFHPYNTYPLDMGAIIGAMNRRGYAIDPVSREEFAAAVEAMKNDPKRAEELQGVLHYAGHFLNGRRMASAPNDWTTTALYRLGFRWRPAADEYLAAFLQMLEGLAVFD